jgi:hypothetical protein
MHSATILERSLGYNWTQTNHIGHEVNDLRSQTSDHGHWVNDLGPVALWKDTMTSILVQ